MPCYAVCPFAYARPSGWRTDRHVTCQVILWHYRRVATIEPDMDFQTWHVFPSYLTPTTLKRIKDGNNQSCFRGRWNGLGKGRRASEARLDMTSETVSSRLDNRRNRTKTDGIFEFRWNLWTNLNRSGSLFQGDSFKDQWNRRKSCTEKEREGKRERKIKREREGERAEREWKRERERKVKHIVCCCVSPSQLSDTGTAGGGGESLCERRQANCLIAPLPRLASSWKATLPHFQRAEFRWRLFSEIDAWGPGMTDIKGSV